MSDSMKNFENESINIKVLCELMDRVTDSWEYTIDFETEDFSDEEMEGIEMAYEGGVTTFQMLLQELNQYLQERNN